MSSRTDGDVVSASPGVRAAGGVHSTIGDSANITFDPYSKCFRFPTPSQNSTRPPTLQGVIVDMSPGAEAFFAKMASNHQDGSDRTIYSGEIIDILDHDESAADEEKNISLQHQIIRHLQSKHAIQTQQLLHQHSTTRHDYENTAAVERKHYLEIMRLMKLQQEEQAAEFLKVMNTATYNNNNQQQQSMQQEKEESANDVVIMTDVGSVSAQPEEASPEGDYVRMNEENELADERTHQEEAPRIQDDTLSATSDDAAAVDDNENQNESEYGPADPTPQKSNTMTSKNNGEQSNMIQDDKDRGISDDASSDGSADANMSDENVNNDDDLDQVMNQAKEEEEEEEGIDNSYRSNDISIKSVHFEMDKEMDEQGTFDGSLRSARSNRSLQSGGSSSVGGKRPSIIRTNSNRSARSIKSERSGTDEGTRDESLRSARSRQSQSSKRSGRSTKSDHSDADEGTKDDSLRSASLRSGRSGRSDRSNLDNSNRSGRSMKSDHSGTRDGSLRSARSGRSGRSDRSNRLDSSNRSGRSMKSDHSGTDARSAGSGRSMQSNNSNRSGRRDDNSQNEEGGAPRDASLESARSDGSSRSRSSSASRSSGSGRSQRSSDSDNSNRSGKSVKSDRSGRSAKSDRSESVGSRNSSVASGRSGRSGKSSRSGRSSRSPDRSESDRGSRDGSLESNRSNRSEVSGRSRSSSIHDGKDESSHGGVSASDRSSVASERDDKDDVEEEASPQSAVIEEPVQKEVPQRARALPPSRAAGANSRQRRKASKEEMAEIKEVMKDRSLDRAERLEKVQQIKAKYAALEEGGDNVDVEEGQDVMVSEAVEMPQAEADDEEQGSDEENEREQSKEEKAEIKKVKKDSSLSKKDKKKMIKKIKAKYDKLEKDRKAAENVVVPTEGEQGEAIEDDPEQSGHGEEIKRETSKEEKAEIKKVMKDESLSKKEKKKKIKTIKAKYDEIEKERMAVENTNAPIEGHQGGVIEDDPEQSGHGEEIKRETSKEEKAEIKKVMKDKSLSKKDKKKMIKKIKAKYDKEMATATQDNVNAEVQERSVSPVPNEPSARSISPLPLHSNNTSSSSIPKDLMAPLEDEGLQTDRTPMKKLVKMMETNDPLLDVLKLDGRKKVKPEDWEAFFQSLESNNSLTHLSISRCDLSDEIAVNLVLALVENETLVALKLSSNKGLTDETGKGFIKVLTQSNKTLKKLDLSKTRVSKRAHERINGIMEKRDNQKKLTMMQEMRQNKIKELLSFSAGDNVAAKRLSEQVLAESDDEGNDGSVYSGRSGKSGRRQSVRTGAAGRGMNRTASGRQLAASMRASKRSLNASGQSLNLSGHGLNASRGAGMRSSMTARTMAQLGGDSLGADTKKIREQRKLKGECEDCGQRCFQKTMFKSTPLTIPNVVYEGRCLKCNPM